MKNHKCYSLIVAAIFLLNPNLQAAEYLAEDLSLPTTVESSLEGVVQELSGATVLAIGESHAAGHERRAMRDLYTRLSTVLPQRLPCLVEDVQTDDGSTPNLIDQDAQLLPAANGACSALINVVGNSPAATTYRRSLANAFVTSNQVITHSGFRHIQAFGRIYPDEFKPARVDTADANTIVDQLPSSVARRAHVVAVSFFNRDELPMLYLAGRLSRIARQPSSARTTAMDNLLADVQRIFAITRFVSSGGAGSVRYFSTDKLNNGSSPSRRSYVALVDQQVFDLGRLVRFLLSSEVRAYVSALPVGSPVYATLVTGSQMGFGGDLNVNQGGMFIFGRGGYAAIHPDERIQVRMPSAPLVPNLRSNLIIQSGLFGF